MKYTVKELRVKSIKDYEAQRSAAQQERDNSLVMAHNSLICSILTNIEHNVAQAIKHDPRATTTTVVNPYKGVKLYGHSLDYVYRGTFIQQKAEYSRRHHHLAGIKETVLEAVNRILATDGIDEVVDVTDPTKNGDLVLKVIFKL